MSNFRKIAMRANVIRSAICSALFVGGAAASLPATAQSIVYCCTDANGRKVCADFLPPECQKRAYEERDEKGYIVKKVDAPLTPAQQAQRDAEAAKKAALELIKLEEQRRNSALLATYANEKDIDNARDRELADFEKLVVQAEKAVVEAQKRQAKVAKEQEFYKGKALPKQLKEQLDSAARDIAAKQQAVEGRKSEKIKLAAKYDDEKRRFIELKAGKSAKSASPEKPKREVVVQPNEGAAAEGSAKPAEPPKPAQ
jgi:hypothetical protein